MSELINNREKRREELKELIKELHEGKSVDEVKERFKKLTLNVDAGEISALEEALLKEGMLEEEIKRLCDVHVAVFKEALEAQQKPESVPGHPVHTLKLENNAIAQVVEKMKGITNELIGVTDKRRRSELIGDWIQVHSKLQEIESHYSRKENVLFPFLEKHGIMGPTSVMWAIHDDIRAQLKEISRFLSQIDSATDEQIKDMIERVVRPMLNAITEMIYKEENILFPLSLETLNDKEWMQILDQSDELGYTLVKPEVRWTPRPTETGEVSLLESGQFPEGLLRLDTGVLTLKEISALLNRLPVDVTFVDKDNIVRYFSKGEDRIFPRLPAIIGRRVENCHPPESVHVVETIINDFKERKRDFAEFWINMEGRFIHIRYFPVRDKDGEYMGVLEVSQDVTEIRKLEGEKRLLDEVDSE